MLRALRLPVSCTIRYRLIFGRPYDPEGFLGVLSACTLTYCGLMAGRCCVLFTEHKSRLLRWLLWGVALLFLAG